MTYATTAANSRPNLNLPHVAVPKFRWPHLSQRARALLMMALMISPAFLADDIGYCIQRLFMTRDQIAAQQVPDGTMPTDVYVFHVACMNADAPRERWAEFAANHGWPRYPQAGPGCFKPDRALYGIVGLKAFNVACPTMVLSVADQRRWVAYAQNHGWTDYAQAGVGCVDP
jgi:hypothetical protein